MLHCPYCGTNIKEDESYCIKCGKQLPDDINNRLKNKKYINKLWYLPAILAAVLLISSGIYYLILENQTAEAKNLYEQGEKQVLAGDYEQARDLFADALEHKKNFNHASTSLDFMDKALNVQRTLTQSTELLKEQDYQQALSLINEAENDMTNFNGPAVNEIIDLIVSTRNTIKIEQLKDTLKQEPSIDDLKILLWEADSIKDNEAKKITATIRDQIIDYSYSKASEQLKNKQFNDALIFVEDGLKYAPNAEKLQSLKTTIDKEQVAFETAQQQRIEQAINTAAKEQEINEKDAIELVSVAIESDKQGKLVVIGEVKSVATIPINSILIEYSLLTESGTEILSNEVYVYPDKLYPEEKGDFEFTHFDIDEENKNLKIEVSKITWYTE
ncbi:zinc ribbon domain-containing protein [Virgibacillus profundi]|uniref:Zinc ribbon domain-containing protein n=1 Tax=Virgibacillus profundi TaxID=2024555 RepID=A0A2A2IAY5_9BACI|nr:DUF2116 family Zn-ribbon domain-containing protein [Virgibacillus profundi]PAV28787.1 zinc ribbon domain-containing protein [Virgibacillus profundi]PXY52955.1 DUF2116 family Zn-ribbon domain-containing protein [Virgibacillus profundi]